MAEDSPQNRPLRPFAQQLDVDGQLHDIPLETRPMRLFEHEPQIPGQTYLEMLPEQE
jgi:hypothetical protein